MKLYVYLTEKEWVSTWTNGGTIPLFLASNYKKDYRKGTFTPDENRIKQLDGCDDKNHHEMINVVRSVFGNSTGNFIARNNSYFVDGRSVAPPTLMYTQKNEDVLILCLSTECNKSLADRLGKEACVEILDIEKFKTNIDDQLGIVGQKFLCQYTSTENRHHFLKSTEDAWQKEYRIIWKVAHKCEVDLPAGLCIEKEL